MRQVQLLALALMRHLLLEDRAFELCHVTLALQPLALGGVLNV